jgi:Ca-activated chloride channel homolog
MSLYDSGNGSLLYNYIHTMNDKGVPDTLILDPHVKYRIVVHTLPPVVKDNVFITPAKHTIIPIETPQGDLQLKMEGVTQYKNLQVVIKKVNEPNIIHVQEINSKKRYLTGKYDLEVLTTPRIFIKGVTITQSKTTIINILQPGKLEVAMSLDHISAVYVQNRNSFEWVCDVPVNAGRHVMVLQPGTYKIVSRARMGNRTIYTFEREITIRSGELTQVNLNR